MESYQEVLEISDGSDDDDVGNNIVERNNSKNNDTNLHSPSSTKKRAQNSPQSYIASPSKRRRGLGGTKTIDLTEVTVDHLESSEPETSNSSSSQNDPRIVGLDSLAEETSIIEIDSDEEDTEHPSIQYPMLKFIGSLKTKIVGVRYYHGIVTNGEHVYIKREPESAYDKNAIRIDNVQHTQVGHMPAHLAATLSPLLQQNVCIVEGSVIGERATFSAPLLLDFFTHPDIQEDLRRTLESRGIHLQDLRKTGSLSKKTIQKKDRSKSEYGASNDSGIQNFEQIQAKCTVVNSRAFSQALDALSLEAEDLKNMVPSDQPSRLQTSLLYYQRQGLRWMLQKENPRLPKKEEVVQLWRQTNNNSYINIATSFTTSSSPKLARGGLLADDMGLGKTLQIIALIVADRDTQPQAFVPFGIGEPTLIVAPTSLMSSWYNQIEQHVKASDKLSVTIYHGHRKMAIQDLSAQEIIITTYGTVLSEFKSLSKTGTAKQGLFALTYKRIVLDECHKIRNPKAQTSDAVTALKATSRWALSGTPVINTYSDLQPLIRFLGWTGGIEDRESFNKVLTRPLMDGNQVAIRLLRVLMQDLSLRRRKDMEVDGKRLIDLPSLIEYVHKLEFTSSQEKDTYDTLAKEAKGMLTKNRSPHLLLEILLRMRQAACCLDLIGDERLAGLKALDDMKTVEFTEENKLLLRNLLGLTIENNEDCAICFEPIETHIPVITYCKHTFGQECILKVIETQAKCPFCRAPLNDAQFLGLPRIKDENEATEELMGSGDSSKIQGLMDILSATRRKDSSIKTIVFSQWTKFLSLIQLHLDRMNMGYSRIDGSMTVKARDQSIHDLEHKDGCNILLASLSVASVGLNLVMASQVILVDPWYASRLNTSLRTRWAPAIEDQAVDRVYRLGQTKPVTVFRLVMEGTIEEKVLEIQRRKREMSKNLDTGEVRKHVRETRRADMELLLS